MSSRFKSVQSLPVVSKDKKLDQDYQYWRSLQFPVTIKEKGVVSDVCFQPTHPFHFAATCSTRVQLYDPGTSEVVKTFSRFHDTVYGASFRSDGKLLVAGNEDTKIRLFDVGGRVPLRIFKGHSRPVHVTKFCNNKKEIFSGGDDKIVKVWDISTEKVVNNYTNHKDYIRCGCITKSNENLIVTGSYDHTISVYDKRTDKLTTSINHGSPLESILMFPTGTILLSAGGNTIKVWDILQGGKLLASASNHHKTITSLKFNHDFSRLLSAGLDGHVKIYDVATYQTVHTIDYPSPILSMDISADDKALVVGMADKTLSIRHRKQAHLKDDNLESPAIFKRKQKEKNAFMKERIFTPNKDDIIIHHKTKKWLAKYDFYFRRFEHTKALDAALATRVQVDTPEVTVAVIQVLMQRGNIKAALAGRQDNNLIILLRFLCRNLVKISFAPVLMEIAEMVVEIYLEEMDEFSVPVTNLFQRLCVIVRKETKLQKELNRVKGAIDVLLSSNSQMLCHNELVKPE